MTTRNQPWELSQPAGQPDQPSQARKVLTTGWARGLIGVLAFVLIVEALGSAGVIDQSVVPTAFTVLGQAASLLGNTQFLADVGATLEAWAAGLAIAVAVAVPCGLVLGSVPIVRSATRAVVEFLRPIPSVALIPLALLVLGPGMRTNITLIVYASVWPVLFNTIYGLDDVDPVAKETLRAFGFGRLAVILRVSLPAAGPFIATGIRLASSIAIILNIGTGVLTGRVNGNGIGAFISDLNASTIDTTQVLAAALWAGVLGLALNALLVWAERRMLPWHRAYFGEA
jgi:NitT/TauT family transport system permease protein